MKKILLAMALAACFLELKVAAQDAPVLPAGFVFRNLAPEKNSWTVACVYQDKESDTQAKQEAYMSAMRKMSEANPELAKLLSSNPGLGTPKPRVEKIVITKVGKNRREEIFHAGGIKEERWDIDSFYVQKDPFTGRVSLERCDNENKLGDFPECSWISAKTFRGVEKISGREALIFESREQRLSLEDPRLYQRDQGSNDQETIVTVRAALDQKTLLPLMISWDDQTRTYEFNSVSPQSLVLPADLAAAVEKSNHRAALAVRPLAPP